MVSKLLTAMNECTEWGQISILECLSRYDCQSENEAQSICERVTSRLSHSNAALVFSAVKVLLKAIVLLGPENSLMSQILTKISPPLITMLSLEFEIQYVALRNINLIVQKYPSILKQDTKSFFVKYNDPIYIKLEKLEILIKLVSEENVNQILAELKEYASEVDVDFVRRSVRAIGTCALMTSANRCVNTLVELIQTKIPYVVQEAVIATRDIMRKFPKTYDGLIQQFSGNWWTIDEPESRAAFIWIVGELSDNLENSQDILKSFVSSFFEENSAVQLQVLTAVVKLFLKKPTENQDLVQELLTLVTQKVVNPDIRDRGFIYWRLLSTDLAAAKEIILAPKPAISSESDNLNPNLLDELLLNLSSLSSVYHKLPKTLVDGRVHLHDELKKSALNLKIDLESSFKRFDEKLSTNFDSVAQQDSSTFNNYQDDLLDLDFSIPFSGINLPQATKTADSMDMLSDIFYTASVSPGASKTLPTDALHQVDLFSVVEHTFNNDSYKPPPSTWLTSVAGKGLEVVGQFNLSPSLSISMTLFNQALAPFSNFTIQLNRNYFGLAIKGPVVFPLSLSPKNTSNVTVSLEFCIYYISFLAGPPTTTSANIEAVQVAIKNNVHVFYFTVNFPLHFYFKSPEECSITEQMFDNYWSSLPPDSQQERMISTLPISQTTCLCWVLYFNE
ncbi:hypothetical protein MXB_746 [Myxobolus squamalis]|nr:hypothetical protein MXB_746 [Myxobolus squamalis]